MKEHHKMLMGQGSKVFDRDMRTLCPASVPLNRFAEMSERARLDAMVEAATPPAECGPDMPVSPARGAFRTFAPREVVAGSAGTARPSGYRAPGEDRPRLGLARADIFDVMREDARARHARAGTDAPFVPPFTPGQEQIGRDYRDLTEWRDGAGIKCASMEGRSGGCGGGGGSFMDAYADAGRALAAMQRRIGTGAAMQVRRIRPSARGKASRGIITDRVLVDMVCLGDMTLTDVLKAHGWVPKGEARDVLRRALAAALDRMQGYRDKGT